MRKSRLLAAALLLCLTLCACGARQKPQTPYRMVLITKSTTTQFWLSAIAGAGAAKAEYNVDLSIVGPETEEDYECQNRYIRQAVSDGADAIIFSAISYSENAAAIDEAADAGVKIVVIDSDVASDRVDARIGTNNLEAGRMAASAALDMSAPELYVGVVNFDQTSRNGQEREMGLTNAFREDARVREIRTIHVQTSSEAAREGAKRLLDEYPETNVLIGLNEPLSVGVGMAAEELGLGEAVRVVGFDTNVTCVDLLRSGDMSALIVQNPYAMGYLGVETAWKILEGKPFDAVFDTATAIVTRENMFTAEGQQALSSFS